MTPGTKIDIDGPKPPTQPNMPGEPQPDTPNHPVEPPGPDNLPVDDPPDERRRRDDEPAEPDRTNVVDLMAALEKSLAQEPANTEATPQNSAPAKPKRAAAAQAAKPVRKRA